MHREVFSCNQISLTMIPEIVCLLRKQRFYKGNTYVGELIENLGTISDYVVKMYAEDVLNQEWMPMLQALLKAQQNQDYAMLADLLEGDLLPFLQKLQLDLQNHNDIAINEYWEENILCIRNLNRDLYDKIIRDCENKECDSVKVQYEPMLAVNGQPTLKVTINGKEICMHSTINPEREAKLLAESWMESGKHMFQVFGIGMGYHIKALLDADAENKVYVLEHRIEPLFMAFTYFDWKTYFMDGRLQVVYEPDITILRQKLKENKKESSFCLHYPSLQCVEQCEVKEALEDYFIFISSMQEHGRALEENFAYLQSLNLPSCEKLCTLFEGKTVVIAAGGPSLEDELEDLKRFRANIVILSVGTVARKLIDNGIYPDAIMITDSLNTMYRQIEGLDIDTIPMLLLSTASKSVPLYYKGPIYLVYQYGFEAAERLATERDYRLFETGGSVTTTALDVSIRLGAKRIILAGADMAYTDNHSHVKGIGYEIKDVSGLRKRPKVGGGMVYTSKNLDVYRKWIERRILTLETPSVYNASRGARIAGTIEAKLIDILNND